MTTRNPWLRIVLTLHVALVSTSGSAAEPVSIANNPPVIAAQASQDALSQGTVVSVNREAGKLFIKHGPLVNLDMPAMTMGFRAADKAALANLQAGDKIVFRAEMRQGALIATSISPAP